VSEAGQTLLLVCPFCGRVDLTPVALRAHLCPKLGLKVMHKQSWWTAVDEAREKAGLPPMIYGYEVHYLTQNGETKSVRCAGDAKAAPRAAILKCGYKEFISISPYAFRGYCAAFGVPGSKM
jgi:hypothetical protein